MKLSVSDRLTLLGVLPEAGDFRTMKTIQTLRTDLLFNEDEVKKFELKQEVTDDGKIRSAWNGQTAEEVEIKIGEIATEVIVAALKELDTKKTLRAEHLAVYGRFVKDK